MPEIVAPNKLEVLVDKYSSPFVSFLIANDNLIDRGLLFELPPSPYFLNNESERERDRENTPRANLKIPASGWKRPESCLCLGQCIIICPLSIMVANVECVTKCGTHFYIFSM